MGAVADSGARYQLQAVSLPQGTLVTAVSLNPTDDTLASLVRVELIASGAIVLALCVLALWTVAPGAAAPRGHVRDRRGDRLGGPDPSGAQRGREHRGRPAGGGAQRHAGPDRDGLRGEDGVRGQVAPVRGRRLPRAADAVDLHPRVRRTPAQGGLQRRGGPATGLGPHRTRGGTDGRPGRRPAALGPTRPGTPPRDGARRPAPGGRSTRWTTPGRSNRDHPIELAAPSRSWWPATATGWARWPTTWCATP